MIKVNELFTGIGAFRKALMRQGIPHEVVGISEIDKYAIQSYTEMYGATHNYGDISKVERLSYADLWTYGFPCQDISVAGAQKGIVAGKTRSGLLFEVERLLRKAKEEGIPPQYLILENVKNLIGRKFRADFDAWLEFLGELGYNNYWQVLNAKDYGIPQNRERVFVVSVRKDIDDGSFEFPEKQPLSLKLKDMLEENPGEKYYISQKMVDYLISTTNWAGSRSAVINKDTASTITTKEGARRCDASNYMSDELPDNCDIKWLGNIYGGKKGGSFAGGVYDGDGISPTLNTMTGGNRQPMIPVKEATKQGYTIATEGDSINFEQPKSQTRRGRVGHGIANTLNTGCQQGVIETCIAASRGRNPENPSDRTTGAPTEQRLEINENGTSNTITTVQKDNLVVEPAVLTPKRTEYGKQIRKAYEAGEVVESRHNMTQLEPRTDGVSNTLTTVQKDNLVAEPKKEDFNTINDADVCPTITSHYHKEETQNFMKNTTSKIMAPCVAVEKLGNLCEAATQSRSAYEKEGLSPTLTTGHSNTMPFITDETPAFRIRKLTPRECFRLMGFDDSDFDKLTCSNTQLYKQAGNSIVVNVLEGILKQLLKDKEEERLL